MFRFTLHSLLATTSSWGVEKGQQMERTDVEAGRSAWAKLAPDMARLFRSLWACPELPGMEYKSVAILTEFLKEHGFAVEIGIGGVPTAFLARKAGAAKVPRIGILAEYDALPSLDNAAIAKRTGSGRLPGHGCGHNHIGPANCGAAIAAAMAMEALSVAGEVCVIGCPAEEICWGKIALQDAGVFDGFDALLTSHGDYQNGSLSRPCHAMASGEFIFRGDSAHAGIGVLRNALKTAEEAMAAFVAAFPEQFPGINEKHVFRSAGIMPGVMPDEVRLWCSLRHRDLEPVMAAYYGMERIFRDVAARTGVEVEEKFVSACRGYLANDVLGKVLEESLRIVGAPKWSAADIAFMEALSLVASPGKPFDLHRDISFFNDGIDYYAQDDGDASWIVPLGRVNWAYPTGVPIHHWAWTALSGHTASDAGPLMASEALALAVVDLMINPNKIAQAKAELAARVGPQQIRVVAPGVSQIMRADPLAFWEARW
jgi:aminobenzoyl-glutamate utilization protein B